MQTFKPAAHPWVKLGHTTEQEVQAAFLRDCEVGGEIEGRVTANEFVKYYARAYPSEQVSMRPSSCIIVGVSTNVSTSNEHLARAWLRAWP